METEIVNNVEVIYNSGKEDTLKKISQYLFDLIYKKIIEKSED